MSDRQKLLEEIEAFLRRSGLKPTRFGALAVNDTALVSRLRKGGDVRTETAARLRSFMGGYRPKQRAPARTAAHA